MTHYAWSNFPVERNEFGQTTKTIKAGDEVSQSDLNVSDEDWEELLEVGAVREEKYPDVEPGQSPAEYMAAHPEELEEDAPLEPSPASQVKSQSAPPPPLKPAPSSTESKPAENK